MRCTHLLKTQSIGVTLALFLGGFFSGLRGAAINAANCTTAAVQAAINQAVAGDTVQIPSGTCDWSSSNVSMKAGIHLKGAGKANTILFRTSAAGGNMLTVDGANGLQAVVSDLTMQGVGNESTYDRGIWLINSCRDFRLYNLSIKKFGESGIDVRGNARGVIYNCDFVQNYRPGLGYGVVVYGPGTYGALTLGTQDAVFVEDCTFDANRHHIAANGGAKYVFRYNQALNVRENAQAVDAHGPDGAHGAGTRQWEIYNNTISNAVFRFAGVGIWGGDGVIFNNTFTNCTNPIWLSANSANSGSECSTPYPIPEQTRSAYIWGNASNNSPLIVVKGICANHIQLGRDYFTTAKPGYVPYPYPHPLRISGGIPVPTNVNVSENVPAVQPSIQPTDLKSSGVSVPLLMIAGVIGAALILKD